MSSDVRIACASALFGWAIVAGMQSAIPQALPLAGILVLLAAILLWQELRGRKDAAQGQADQTVRSLEALAEIHRSQEKRIEELLAVVRQEALTRRHDAEDERTLLQEGAETIRNTVEALSVKLDEVHQTQAKCMEEILADICQAEQTHQQDLKKHQAKLCEGFEKIQMALEALSAETKKGRTSVREEIATGLQLLQDLAKEQTIAVNAIADAQKNVGESIVSAVQDNLHAMTATKKEIVMELHTMEDASKPIRSFFSPSMEEDGLDIKAVNNHLEALQNAQTEIKKGLHNIGESVWPLYPFLQPAESGDLNISSVMESLEGLKDLPDDLRDATDQMKSDMRSQVKKISEAMEDFSDVPQAFENAAKNFETANEAVLKKQEDLIQAMQIAIEQGRSLSSEDTKILREILMRK